MRKLMIASAAFAIRAQMAAQAPMAIAGEASPRRAGQTDSRQRAAAIVDGIRASHAERLANAALHPPTRQLLRAFARREGKMPIGMSRKDWHRMKGLLPA
jgi:MoxR-like ATPase